MKYFSEWTHEYLGHCCIGSLVGGNVISYYVSWIWPLEFGYAIVTFFGSFDPIPRILMFSGGIMTCLIAAFSSQIIIALIIRKKEMKFNLVLILLNFLFWYGFWAFMNSVGYLLVGGLLKFGDIQYISDISGISHIFFLIPGFFAFFFLYYLISRNCYKLFNKFTKIDAKWILSLFWLLIPIVYLFFVSNPAIYLTTFFIAISFPLMFIPSLISIFLSKYIIKNRRVKEEG